MISDKAKHQQPRMQLVMLEDLVPQDHLLRKIAQHIDFSFLRELVKPYYTEDHGRPGVDPETLFKMIFVGYLYGVRSERQLEKEVQVNVAYRWFIGLDLMDTVPHHSTISYNRCVRLKGSDVFQQIFDTIVGQAMQAGLISGRALATDSTHIKANANKRRFVEQEVTVSPLEYVALLNQAVTEDRQEHGKKPLKDAEPSVEVKKVKQSLTDPDCGYMHRDGKPEGFYYLDHRSVCLKHNLITDVHITPGNQHDSRPYLERLARQSTRFGFQVEAVVLDAGYLTAPICHSLQEQAIFTVIGHRRFRSKKEILPKRKFQYIPEKEAYLCPNLQMLPYRTTQREGYRIYASDPAICSACPLLKQCTQSKNKRKIMSRHVWESSKEWVRTNRLSRDGKRLYKRRKETIERSFADAKQLHGYRYARLRGLHKVFEQALMTAACQNMKKMALILHRRVG